MNESKLNGNSLDILEENINKLKELFPEIIVEDKIDFDKLKLLLSDEVDDSPERYNFSWSGKSRAIDESQKTSTGTLKPVKEESKDWDNTKNLYIEGDNLEVLKLLQKTYYGKIKMIYIDPPYNTGNDFVYPDNYKDNLWNYLELTGQVRNSSELGKRERERERANGLKLSTNTETSGRYHTNWLNMMYPRLKLARNLLSDEGVIFISIDDNEVENLRKICDEIFGETNFIISFIRKTVSQRAMAKYSNTQHEYCLVYAKNILYSQLYGEKKDFKAYSNPDNDPNGDWSIANPTISKSKNTFGVKNPYTGEINYPPEGRGWGFKEDQIEDLVKSGKLVFSKEKITNKRGFILKSYKKDVRSATNLVNSLDLSTNTYLNQVATKEWVKLFGKKTFDYSKPVSMISKLIEMMGDGDFKVLDFFSGSGTTAHAVMNINSQNNKKINFIMVQIPETIDKKEIAYEEGYRNICEIAKDRIKTAGEKINDLNIDTGFKVFKLDSSNLNKWNPDYNNVEQTVLDSEDNLIPRRTELDLVYEIMLKYGIDLTLPIEEYEINNKKVYSIGFGALLICLDNQITKEIAIPLIELKNKLSPETSRVVFKDNGFASDSDKTNIKETLKTNDINEFITI